MIARGELDRVGGEQGGVGDVDIGSGIVAEAREGGVGRGEGGALDQADEMEKGGAVGFVRETFEGYLRGMRVGEAGEIHRGDAAHGGIGILEAGAQNVEGHLGSVG